MNIIWPFNLPQLLRRAFGMRPAVSSIQSEEEFMIIARTLLRVIDLIDHYTYSHSIRLAKLAAQVAKEIDLTEADLKILYHGALLHDIGKISIGKSILCKTESLTHEEWLIVKRHPVLGTEMLEAAVQYPEILSLVKHHHENFDGSGYPDGLAGEEIPFLARIVNIADSFDAMTSQRPYHPTRSVNEALQELENCASKQFDPILVQHFVTMIRKHQIV
ncbi:MAG: HD-GYP domain-containing protein [Syntrophomonadaceae bacterium]|nr:HD-GYP domain-containing protein [Syntrophomonadaceae bacterium]MDD3023735.1 HD-GYP domain-containing protein [Syntrophomonadaceae bacterium]